MTEGLTKEVLQYINRKCIIENKKVLNVFARQQDYESFALSTKAGLQLTLVGSDLRSYPECSENEIIIDWFGHILKVKIDEALPENFVKVVFQ